MFIVLVVSASLRSSHLKIWTLFLHAVIWRWEVVFGGSDGFFGALDGEEFFAIEGSCTISSSELVDIDIVPTGFACPFFAESSVC